MMRQWFECYLSIAGKNVTIYEEKMIAFPVFSYTECFIELGRSIKMRNIEFYTNKLRNISS